MNIIHTKETTEKGLIEEIKVMDGNKLIVAITDDGHSIQVVRGPMASSMPKEEKPVTPVTPMSQRATVEDPKKEIVNRMKRK
jgi:hypothetical protein